MNKSVFLILLSFIIAGCKGSEESGRKTESSITLQEFLARHEKSFDPTQYEVSVELIKAEDQKRSSEDVKDIVPVTAVPETIPGFRVQVLFTQDIDQATTLKDTLSVLIPDLWVYTVYEAPYYKVRIGDFLDRPSANKMVATLVEKGFKDAWVVPDQIVKNQPPKPQPPPMEPAKQEDQQH